MNTDILIAEHDRLNEAFSTSSVLTANRKELERLLLVAVEIKPKADENVERNKRRADLIRHLLQIRISEEFQKRTLGISVAAFCVSLISLVFTGYRLWIDVSTK